MSKIVTIVDCGTGNIFSVARAFQHCGAEVLITTKAHEVLNASSVVLPGVGAFSNSMNGLTERKLIEPLKEYASTSKPLLGICVGMQMLFTASTEFGEHSGLDIIGGRILPIEPKNAQGLPLKVPHIGWSTLTRQEAEQESSKSILKYLGNDESAYFVHSFMAVPDDEQHRLADTFYGNSRISAVVRKGNIYGCQFHPEKSGITGLKIIKGFLEI